MSSRKVCLQTSLFYDLWLEDSVCQRNYIPTRSRWICVKVSSITGELSEDTWTFQDRSWSKMWNPLYQGKAHRELRKEDISRLVTALPGEEELGRVQQACLSWLWMGKKILLGHLKQLEPCSFQRFKISTIGRQKYGDSRSMGSFPTHPVPGRCVVNLGLGLGLGIKSEIWNTFTPSGLGGVTKCKAQCTQISVDVSKFLFYCDERCLDTEYLCSFSMVVPYVEKLRSLKVGPAGNENHDKTRADNGNCVWIQVWWTFSIPSSARSMAIHGEGGWKSPHKISLQ